MENPGMWQTSVIVGTAARSMVWCWMEEDEAVGDMAKAAKKVDIEGEEKDAIMRDVLDESFSREGIRCPPSVFFL
jgi:hypothetical protein